MTDDPATVTELDVADPEVAAAGAWVYCGNCGDGGEAMGMVEQFEGDYLCCRCDSQFQREYDEQQRAIRASW